VRFAVPFTERAGIGQRPCGAKLAQAGDAFLRGNLRMRAAYVGLPPARMDEADDARGSSYRDGCRGLVSL
jgi:hypothetical protein